jgi:predicted dithiol-disulfide oxidoreductase (DUF899 family)
MTIRGALAPAIELARQNGARFPNESERYRSARDALLAEEIELRRHIERVAAQRRELPPGGEVTTDYRFEGQDGPARLVDLFGEKQTLVVYSFMFGPEREQPCPMCTSLLSAWDGEAADIEQRVALAVVARSPIDRQIGFKVKRCWRRLKLYSDTSGDYSRDYHALSPKGEDDAAFTVFTRQDGVVRHFWSSEMASATADPGQDPRGAPDPMPIWNILDSTPEGRGADWHPKLDYPS